MTPEPSHDTEIIEMEPQQQNNDEVEQYAGTQEPTSLNIPVKIPTNPGTEESEDEFIHDFMDEDCTETLKSSHDIEIIDIELQ